MHRMKMVNQLIKIASSNGHAAIVSILLNSGANPHTANKEGFTPLMSACQTVMKRVRL